MNRKSEPFALNGEACDGRRIGMALPYSWMLRSAILLVRYDTGWLEPQGFSVFIALKYEDVG